MDQLHNGGTRVWGEGSGLREEMMDSGYISVAGDELDSVGEGKHSRLTMVHSDAAVLSKHTLRTLVTVQYWTMKTTMAADYLPLIHKLTAGSETRRGLGTLWLTS
ncbi:hypothetical protein RRG08_018492 [Elysia crispata]|uniref:Uncharacterized protein n=1 Tax=Elysia crispata TaxID=231223 RepID=A0AAE0YZ18_9GAST|nr:hypothetical protein RRG08_018492 [Elysia crispata]